MKLLTPGEEHVWGRNENLWVQFERSPIKSWTHGFEFYEMIWKVSAYSLDSEITECMLNVKRRRSRTETWTMHMFNKVEKKKDQEVD